MSKFLVVLTAVVLLGVTSSTDAGMLFGDNYSDLSNTDLSNRDAGNTTMSVAPSPGGKAGTSLQVAFDGVTTGWSGALNDLGGSPPTTGTATYLWHVYYEDIRSGHLGVSPSLYTDGGFPAIHATFWTDDTAPADLGLFIIPGLIAPWAAAGTWPGLVTDTWISGAMVIDLDATTDNLDVYVTTGLEVDAGDFWVTKSLDLTGAPIKGIDMEWYFAAGVPGNIYVDDITVNSGEDLTFIPEPATWVLLLGAGLALAVSRRRK